MPTKLTLARSIRDKRVRAGLSQSEAAKAAGIRRATWTALESGEANPRLSTIEVVAYVLNCEVVELFMIGPSKDKDEPCAPGECDWVPLRDGTTKCSICGFVCPF